MDSVQKRRTKVPFSALISANQWWNFNGENSADEMEKFNQVNEKKTKKDHLGQPPLTRDMR